MGERLPFLLVTGILVSLSLSLSLSVTFFIQKKRRIGPRADVLSPSTVKKGLVQFCRYIWCHSGTDLIRDPLALFGWEI